VIATKVKFKFETTSGGNKKRSPSLERLLALNELLMYKEVTTYLEI